MFENLRRIREPLRDPVVPENVKIVVDLDRLLAEPVGFRWKNRVHLIRPMSNEVFLKVVNDISKLTYLAKQPKVDHPTVMAGYARVFATCCDTIKIGDVYQMSQAQMAALLQQIHDIITGKAFAEEKKNRTEPTQDPLTIPG